jgi:drug/metabolite transporter (DMT)-like permease
MLSSTGNQKKSTNFLSTSVLQMSWAVLLFAGMNLCAKGLSGIPSMEIVFFRCAISILLTWFWLKKVDARWAGSPENRLRLWGRGISGTVALFLFFLTIQKLPLATAVTIQYLSPVFTAILAMFFLGEKLRRVQWFFFAISFSGIVLLKGFDDRISWLFLGLGVLSAFLAGVAYVFVRSLSGREHPLVIVFYFQMIGTLLGGSFTAFDFKMPLPWEWLLLLGVGLLAHFAQVNLTKAIQGEKVGIISSLNFFGAIYASIFGWLLFNESVTWGNVLAMGLVITGVLLNIWTNAGGDRRLRRFVANLMNR